MSGYRKPWKHPQKISEEGEPVFVSGNLSPAEYELFKNIAAGYGLRTISYGFNCDIATIHRTLQRIAKKITQRK